MAVKNRRNREQLEQFIVVVWRVSPSRYLVFSSAAAGLRTMMIHGGTAIMESSFPAKPVASVWKQCVLITLHGA
jgi:hypothetical protein